MMTVGIFPPLQAQLLGPNGYINQSWGRWAGSVSYRSVIDIVRDYQAKTDGETGVSEIIKSALSEADNKTLYFPPGYYKIDSNMTFPNNVNIVFDMGAMLVIPDGLSLSMTGPIEAGLYQIFDCVGTGNVSLVGAIKEVYPQWWGASGNGVTVDSTAFQKMFDSYAKNIYIPWGQAGNYNFGSTAVTVKLGSRLRMNPATRLTYNGTDAAIIIDAYPNQINWMDWQLTDIYSSGAYGIRITNDGHAWADYYVLQSHLNVHNIWNYTTAGIYIEDVKYSEGSIALWGGYPTGAPDSAAWGLKMPDSNIPCEGNQIYVNSYSWQGLSAGLNPNFNMNNIVVGVGVSAPDIYSRTKIDMGGVGNIVHCQWQWPENLDLACYNVRLRPTAKWNTFIGGPRELINIVDESPVGSGNVFSSPRGYIQRLVNPSGESWTGPILDGWVIGGTATATQETSDVKHGLHSIKVTATGATAAIAQLLPSDCDNRTIVASGWFKAALANTHISAIEISSDAGVQQVAIPNDGKWHFTGVSATVTTNPVFRIYANTEGSGSGDVIYCDGMSVVYGDAPVWPGDL